VDSSTFPLPKYETAVKADKAFLEPSWTGDEQKVEKVDAETMADDYPDYTVPTVARGPFRPRFGTPKGLGAEKRSLLDYRNSGDVTATIPE